MRTWGLPKQKTKTMDLSLVIVIMSLAFTFVPIVAGASESVDVPVFPKSLVVTRNGEKSFVEIKAQPDMRSGTIGKIYGSLTGVEVLGQYKGYSFVRVRDYETDKIVKGYIPQKSLKLVKTRQDWGVLVVLNEQKMYIYRNKTLLKSIIVSTGMADIGTGTPTGTYLVGSRGKSFFSPKYREGGWNWIRFNYGYLFHSVPFGPNGKVIEAEAKKLGQQASHGCVRLSIEDSKWLYSNIPMGTPVIVWENMPVIVPKPELKTIIRINGVEQHYNQIPVKDEGFYELPLRPLVSGLNGELNEWDPEKQSVMVSYKDISIKITADSKIILVNGEQLEMPVPAKMVNGTLYVPLGFMASSLGYEVRFTRSGDETTEIIETVDLSCGNNSEAVVGDVVGGGAIEGVPQSSLATK